jgi:hypothetical protein
MELPELSEATCPPGTVLRPHEVTVDAEEINGYLERAGESAEPYRRGGRLRVPPGLLLGQPIRLIHNNFHYETGVHVSSQLRIQRLPEEGQPFTVSGRVSDLYERNGNKYIALAVTFADAAGATLASIEHVSIYQLQGVAGSG